MILIWQISLHLFDHFFCFSLFLWFIHHLNFLQFLSFLSSIIIFFTFSQGNCEVPHIASDPRSVFMRRLKCLPVLPINAPPPQKRFVGEINKINFRKSKKKIFYTDHFNKMFFLAPFEKNNFNLSPFLYSDRCTVFLLLQFYFFDSFYLYWSWSSSFFNKILFCMFNIEG